MSPRINRSGVSYEVPVQRDGEQVPNEKPEFPGGEQVQLNEGDVVIPADNYDDTAAWSYRDLQEECASRKLDGPLNVAREDLIARLREDDKNAPAGD